MTKDKHDMQDRFISIKTITEKYDISRNVAIKWIRSHPEVRHFKDGRLLRIHKGDFDKMVENQISQTLSDVHDDMKEGE